MGKRFSNNYTYHVQSILIIKSNKEKLLAGKIYNI